MEDIYEKSNTRLIQELGERFRNYRLRYNKTQKEIAQDTGLSVFTISSFEKGTGTGITMLTLLKLLRVINELPQIEKILPELPVSPRLLYQEQNKKRKRARTK